MNGGGCGGDYKGGVEVEMMIENVGGDRVTTINNDEDDGGGWW
jgi:hypothetical protein